jgi:hypothetical protein
MHDPLVGVRPEIPGEPVATVCEAQGARDLSSLAHQAAGTLGRSFEVRREVGDVHSWEEQDMSGCHRPQRRDGHAVAVLEVDLGRFFPTGDRAQDACHDVILAPRASNSGVNHKRSFGAQQRQDRWRAVAAGEDAPRSCAKSLSLSQECGVFEGQPLQCGEESSSTAARAQLEPASAGGTITSVYQSTRARTHRKSDSDRGLVDA